MKLGFQRRTKTKIKLENIGHAVYMEKFKWKKRLKEKKNECMH